MFMYIRFQNILIPRNIHLCPSCVITQRLLEGETPHEGPRRRWKDNIEMDLQEIGWERVDWMHVSG
jgi:hypothetical protein